MNKTKGDKKMLECDDMMEYGSEYCEADHRYCSDNRRRCKKADDYYHKQDGKHYYTRFVALKQKEYNNEKQQYDDKYVLRDYNHDFEDVPLNKPEDAYSSIYYLYKLCDIIDGLGGYSEYLPHRNNKREKKVE